MQGLGGGMKAGLDGRGIGRGTGRVERPVPCVSALTMTRGTPESG